MSFSSLLRTSDKCGAALIGLGLAIVVVAQLVVGVPVAAAMTLIGWGALLTILAATRVGVLALVNLVVYALLVSFTIASQTHAAQNGVEGKLGLLTLTDNVLAGVLLIGLVWYTLHRTSQAAVGGR